MSVHYPGCPQGTDDREVCACEQFEDREITRASVPDPADLIRSARRRGLIKPVASYAEGARNPGFARMA